MHLDADSSTISHIDRSAQLRGELAAVLTVFEEATGLQVCFRALSDAWQCTDGLDIVPGDFFYHRSPFCAAVKARSDAACYKCDNVDLPTVCSPPQGRVVDPFVRTCHAGADELLLPLWSKGMLVAVLFVGQFTRKTDRHSRPTALRHLSDADIQRIRTHLLPLRSYLQDLFQKLDQQRHNRPTGRRGIIETYIRESLSTGPTLAGLASRLSLSRSRTSHLVRDTTGRSFFELVDERRITVAKDLLANGDGKIVWIAAQAGFTNTSYFFRYFKRKTGVTPTTFRKQYRRIIPV